MTIQYVDIRDSALILGMEYDATCVPLQGEVIVVDGKGFAVRYIERWIELTRRGGVMVRVGLHDTGHELAEPILT